jgi:hypothetical protein
MVQTFQINTKVSRSHVVELEKMEAYYGLCVDLKAIRLFSQWLEEAVETCQQLPCTKTLGERAIK